MQKIIICQGLPASGKSTWAKAWVEELPENRIRLNNDDIRGMLGPYWQPSRERLVSKIYMKALRSAIELGYDIVLDNTNMNSKELKRIEDLAGIMEIARAIEIEYKPFFDTPLNVCIERDKERERPVGEEVILGFYDRYKDKWGLCSEGSEGMPEIKSKEQIPNSSHISKEEL